MRPHEQGDAVAQPQIGVENPAAAVREWFEKLTLYCSRVDYESARQIFSENVASFGTQADAVEGLDLLQRQQWQEIWPRTSGFRVLLETVKAGGDEQFAWGMATWTSTGFDKDGREFERPGRATVVLRRVEGRWLAVHTHFSLYRGVNQETYGASPANHDV
jgi:ketosteroid isomerase-like protein